MMMNDFLNVYETELENKFKQKFSNVPLSMEEACRYALFGGGKRVRPTLACLSANFFNIPYQNIIGYAIAIEAIHSYSLVHDDMPCMDNDDLRRGKPTVHKKYGESIALLTGDALLNFAYETLLETLLIDSRYIDGAKLIADCAGINGMIGGQVGEFVLHELDYASYTEISLKKTGALIYASLMAPATLSGEKSKKASLSTFAKNLGLIFQLTDDILDKDKKENASYFTILGKEKCFEHLNKLTSAAIKSIEKYPNSDKLVNYCIKLSQRKY